VNGGILDPLFFYQSPNMVIHICTPTVYLSTILTKLRDRTTPKHRFREYAHLLGDHLIREAVNLNMIPTEKMSIMTPMDVSVSGHCFPSLNRIVAVSILRAGNAFVPSILRLVDPGMDVAQIVIQRVETDGGCEPRLLLDKTPDDVAGADLVVVLDPMLATGGSIIEAIRVLLKKRVELRKILVVHGFAAPDGIERVKREFPEISMVIGVVDEKLNEKSYIIPGLGDFGDRYY
jgi:uracil phosphoribosyltransferase